MSGEILKVITHLVNKMMMSHRFGADIKVESGSGNEVSSLPRPGYILTLSLNGYLNPNVRLMFNYINASVNDRTNPFVDHG